MNDTANLVLGGDPYDDARVDLQVDLQGWGGDDDVFCRLYDSVDAKLAIEIGTWKGQSAATLGTYLKKLGHPHHLFCVDTFMGSPGEGEHDQMIDMVNGVPFIKLQFMHNMKSLGLSEFVSPVALTSADAFKLFRKKGVSFDYVYIDADHSYESVRNDIAMWWQLTNPGGILLGHDYIPGWPGVIRAVDEFAASQGYNVGLAPIRNNVPQNRVWFMYKGK